MEYVFSDSQGKEIKIIIDDQGGVIYQVGGKQVKFKLAECLGYHYQYADGSNCDISDIEDRLWLLMLYGEDRLEYNNNRTETRRHNSLDSSIVWNKDLIDPNIDVEADIIRSQEAESLHNAINNLKPSEKLLIQKLYLDQKPLTQAEFAEELGIKEDSVKQKAWRIRGKIKRILEK